MRVWCSSDRMRRCGSGRRAPGGLHRTGHSAVLLLIVSYNFRRYLVVCIHVARITGSLERVYKVLNGTDTTRAVRRGRRGLAGSVHGCRRALASLPQPSPCTLHPFGGSGPGLRFRRTLSRILRLRHHMQYANYLLYASGWLLAAESSLAATARPAPASPTPEPRGTRRRPPCHRMRAFDARGRTRYRGALGP